jgi:hypothetical protein
MPTFWTEFRALADRPPDVPSVPDQDGPINHRRVTYVSRVPDSRVGLAQCRSRGGANAPVSSAAPSGRLRCQRCSGLRSRTYHCRHYRDPMAYPAIGVCFSPSDGLRKREDAEGAEYCGQWHYGTFDCGITGLGECVGPGVTVVARGIEVDYVSTGVRQTRGHW